MSPPKRPGVALVASMVGEIIPGGRLMYCVVHAAGPNGILAHEAADRAGVPLREIGNFIGAVRKAEKSFGLPRYALLVRKQEGRVARLIIPTQEQK